MTREDALPYVSFVVDTALSPDHEITPAILERATLVGWQCGFEPLFVAVVGATMDTSGVRDVVDEDEAEDIARDYLRERGWFTEPDEDNLADFVLVPRED